MFEKVAFTMYAVTDAARARDFYENTLGLNVGMHGNYGDALDRGPSGPQARPKTRGPSA